MPEVSPTPTPPSVLGGTGRVIAIGFSVRSLAQAIRDTGYRVHAVDYFGDQDLREIAHSVHVLDRWPTPNQVAATGDFMTSIVEKLEHIQAMGLDAKLPLLFTGGFDAWPHWLTKFRSQARLLGPDGSQLKKLRNIDFWQAAAGQAGIGFPEMVAAATTGGWLRKSAFASGGWHVERVGKPPRQVGTVGLRDAPGTCASTAGTYLQREITGRSLGVTCLLPRMGGAGRAALIGATESWTAEDWPGPTEFIYRGSWGPIDLSDEHRRQIGTLAEYVRQQTGLVGWLQADLIQDLHGKLWLLELNPRWTAGMEVLAQTGANPVAAHLQAWGAAPHGRGLESTGSAKHSRFAKAVVYASRDLDITGRVLEFLHALPRDDFADIPSSAMRGQRILMGHPLLTVRAGIPTASEALVGEPRQLRHRLLNQLHTASQRLADGVA